MRKRYEIIATAFDSKGRILSTAKNEYNRSHPLQKYFSEKAGESEMKCWKHAELGAILKAKDKKIYKLLVKRFDNQGNPAMAKPCKSCQEAIKAFGINKVSYTTTEGIITYELIS